jgi:hypothetical protein
MALFFEAQSERIWRIPTAKSVDRPAPGEELVVGPPYQLQPEGWTVTPEEIVYIDRARSNRPAAIRAYRIATKQTRLILALSDVFTDRNDIGVSVSPDSRSVLYSQLKRAGSNVMLGENSH